MEYRKALDNVSNGFCSRHDTRSREIPKDKVSRLQSDVLWNFRG